MSEKKVFVSYASEDRVLARQVLRKLRLLPVRAWSDDQVGSGGDWSRMLRDRLQNSDVFLLIVTPNALESSWVLQELGAAWALGKRIVPVVSDRRLVDKLPVQLAGTQVITVDEIDRLADIIQEPARVAAASH